jgi:lipoate-protein ligase A
MEHMNFEEYINNYQKNLMTKRTYGVVVSSNDTCVLTRNDEFNKEYCNNNGIKIYYTNHKGGTIVNFKEDISIGLFNHDIDIYKIIESFIRFFRSKGLNSMVKDNDIEINGYKVIGISDKFYDNTYRSTAIHISIGMDLELIKNICTKPMRKVPKGLKDFGISTEDIEEFLNTIKEML